MVPPSITLGLAHTGADIVHPVCVQLEACSDVRLEQRAAPEFLQREELLPLRLTDQCPLVLVSVCPCEDRETLGEAGPL